MPKISIILPTYNGSRFIEGAVGSVLVQSFTDFELLIIDDGSTDSTAEIVQRLVREDQRIIYIKNEVNLGIQKSLNRGVRESKGVYIARIDDDDEWIDEDKIKKQVEFLDINYDYVLIGTGVIVVDEIGNELFKYLLPETDEQIRNKILSKNCFVHSSVLFRKDAALKFGGYDESKNTRHIEDYDLWLKLGMMGKFANLGEYSVLFMERENTLSARNRIVQAKKVLFEIKKFKKEYPNFIKGYFLGMIRLFFFYIIKVIPFKQNIINKIKTTYKEN